MGGGTMRNAVMMASIVFSNGGVRRFLTEGNYPASFAAWKAVHSNLPSGVKLVAYDAMPRIVFSGGFPNRQEAKEATLELVDVLDKCYVSSSNSIGNVEDNGQNQLQNKDSLVPAVPGNAIKAFHMFCKNSELQNVVASLASDPKVLKAVLQNEELQEFMHSSNKSDCFNQSDVPFAESLSKNGTGYIHKIKTRVVEMMRKLSDKFWDFFCEDSGTIIGVSSAMGLAIMVIMLVCRKRRT